MHKVEVRNNQELNRTLCVHIVNFKFQAGRNIAMKVLVMIALCPLYGLHL